MEEFDVAASASATVRVPSSRKRILFRVASENPAIASVRYRAMLPSMGLRDLGFSADVSDRDVCDDDLRTYHCLVFAKAFRIPDLRLARRAHKLGIPFILDLCDNIFVPNYGIDVGDEMRFVIKAMAECAAAVVSTGPALTAVIRQEIKNPPPIVEICDPLETRDLTATLLNAFSAQNLSRKRRIVVEKAGSAVQLLILDPYAFRKMLKKRLSATALGPVIRAFDWVLDVIALMFKTPYIAAQKARKRLDRALVQAPLVYAQRRWALFVVKSAGRPMPKIDPTKAALTPLVKANSSQKTLLWFGNHGAPHGDFGMLTLLPILPAIIRVAEKSSIKLIIVSNSEEKYRRHFSDLPFPSEYKNWSALGIFDEVKAADICLLPNSRDAFSHTKSSNRAILSLYHGTPVVATDVPALEDFKHCVVVDDWEGGVLSYLQDPAKVARDIDNARSLIERKYILPVVAKNWAELFEGHGRAPTCSLSLDHAAGLFPACSTKGGP